MTPSSHYLACEGRELHYTEWGAGQPEVVLAWPAPAVTWTTLPRTWRRLTETSVRRLPDGRVTPHCDPAMGR